MVVRAVVDQHRYLEGAPSSAYQVVGARLAGRMGRTGLVDCIFPEQVVTACQVAGIGQLVDIDQLIGCIGNKELDQC